MASEAQGVGIMSWKTTVISDRDIAQYIGDHLEELLAQTEHGQHYPERWGREHQAEVSYTAGEKAGVFRGRGEAMGWIASNPLFWLRELSWQEQADFSRAWQAKLKEWEL